MTESNEETNFLRLFASAHSSFSNILHSSVIYRPNCRISWYPTTQKHTVSQDSCLSDGWRQIFFRLSVLNLSLRHERNYQ